MGDTLIFKILEKVSKDISNIESDGWEFYACRSTDLPIIVIEPFRYGEPYGLYFIVAVGTKLKLKRSNRPETMLEVPWASIGGMMPQNKLAVAYVPQSDNTVADADEPDWFARKVVEKIMEDM